MSAIPRTVLNNGVQMPVLGLGMMLQGEGVENAVRAALDAGYRLFDNAALYGNEAACGEALRRSGVPRRELFISSKLRNACHRYEDALSEFDKSLKRFQTEYLDLYLIHWPCPEVGLYTEAWRALERLYDEGLVRAIGLSNFHAPEIERVLGVCHTPPAVNQLECNPYHSIVPLRAYCRDRGIRTEAWFPLGGPAVLPAGEPAPGRPLLLDERLGALARRYGKSPAQIVLRWEIQKGMIAIPKSGRPERIRENADIFDFALSETDLASIDAMNFNRRVGPDPDTYNGMF